MPSFNNSTFPSQSFDWQPHIDGYRRSNETKGSYCRRHGLKLKQFEYYYRRWYDAAKLPVNETASSAVTETFASINLTTPTVDTPATEKPTQSSVSQESGLELHLVGGARCLLRRDFCQVTLKQLLEVI